MRTVLGKRAKTGQVREMHQTENLVTDECRWSAGVCHVPSSSAWVLGETETRNLAVDAAELDFLWKIVQRVSLHMV